MSKTLRKKIILAVPYILIMYLSGKMAETYRYMAEYGMTAYQITSNYLTLFIAVIRQKPLPSLHLNDFIFAALATLLFAAIKYMKKLDAKKFRHGKEFGSARWAKPSEMAPYMNKDFAQNVILTQTERLTMESRPALPKYARNKNVLVIGGSGSGKTRFYVKPNLMQMHSSYVITDPKGSILSECGQMLKDNGYEIKVLNTIDFELSMHYNPFDYMRTEDDIAVIANMLIENTTEGEKSGDKFWENAERLYYYALIAYIYYEAPDDERNLTTLLDMISRSETREEDEDFKNMVDILFERLEKREGENYAVRNYKQYKLAAGKTAKSILISCSARLAPFNISAVRSIMKDDELDLGSLGDRKTALFIIISDMDNTYNFIAAMAYKQLFSTLVYNADTKYKGRLPVHVRCILDEFANIGKIPDFEKIIAVIRSREISASIILQSKSQLKKLYKESSDIITDNTDSMLFLGGQGKETLKDISELLGKETITVINTGKSTGQMASSSTNYQKAGKELMSVDELATLDGSKCILVIRGERPNLSNKYDITQHPQYKRLSDYDQKNLYDVKKELASFRRKRRKSAVDKK